MNKLLALIAFSVLLMIPAGAQNAFANDIPPQAVGGFVLFDNDCFPISSDLEMFPNEFFQAHNVGLNGFDMDIVWSGSLFGSVTLDFGNHGTIAPSGVGLFTVTCTDTAGSTDFVQGEVLPIPMCGNNILEDGEACDDGGESATCDADCTFAQCGDSTVNSAASEECDDGNAFDGDSCTSQCIAAFCGDGLIFDATSGGTEQCDDGNAGSLDGCTNMCLVTPCGEGTILQAGECVADLDAICGDGTAISNMMCVVSLAVGGYFVGVQHSSLLISATQLTASWIIPVIVSGIGFAIVIARKF